MICAKGEGEDFLYIFRGQIRFVRAGNLHMFKLRYVVFKRI